MSYRPTGTTGNIEPPPLEAWPELWGLDASRVEESRQLVSVALAPAEWTSQTGPTEADPMERLRLAGAASISLVVVEDSGCGVLRVLSRRCRCWRGELVCGRRVSRK